MHRRKRSSTIAASQATDSNSKIDGRKSKRKQLSESPSSTHSDNSSVNSASGPIKIATADLNNIEQHHEDASRMSYTNLRIPANAPGFSPDNVPDKVNGRAHSITTANPALLTVPARVPQFVIIPRPPTHHLLPQFIATLKKLHSIDRTQRLLFKQYVLFSLSKRVKTLSIPPPESPPTTTLLDYATVQPTVEIITELTPHRLYVAVPLLSLHIICNYPLQMRPLISHALSLTALV